jgi:hypothetical protein
MRIRVSQEILLVAISVYSFGPSHRNSSLSIASRRRNSRVQDGSQPALQSAGIGATIDTVDTTTQLDSTVLSISSDWIFCHVPPGLVPGLEACPILPSIAKDPCYQWLSVQISSFLPPFAVDHPSDILTLITLALANN